MAINPRMIVSETAAGVGIGPEQEQLAVVLCELRGQNPYQPCFAAGLSMLRWKAALAEMRIIAEAARP